MPEKNTPAHPKRRAQRHGKKNSALVGQIRSSERSSREALCASVDERCTCARSRQALCGAVARPSNKCCHCSTIRVKNLSVTAQPLSTCVRRGMAHLHSIPFVDVNPCGATEQSRGPYAGCFSGVPHMVQHLSLLNPWRQTSLRCLDISPTALARGPLGGKPRVGRPQLPPRCALFCRIPFAPFSTMWSGAAGWCGGMS